MICAWSTPVTVVLDGCRPHDHHPGCTSHFENDGHAHCDVHPLDWPGCSTVRSCGGCISHFKNDGHAPLRCPPPGLAGSLNDSLVWMSRKGLSACEAPVHATPFPVCSHVTMAALPLTRMSMINDMDAAYLDAMYDQLNMPKQDDLDATKDVHGVCRHAIPRCSLCLRCAFVTEDPCWPGFFLQWASVKAVRIEGGTVETVIPVGDRCLYCKGAEAMMTSAAQRTGVLCGTRNSVLFGHVRHSLMNLEKVHGGVPDDSGVTTPLVGWPIPDKFARVSWDGFLPSVHRLSQITGIVAPRGGWAPGAPTQHTRLAHAAPMRVTNEEPGEADQGWPSSSLVSQPDGDA